MTPSIKVAHRDPWTFVEIFKKERIGDTLVTLIGQGLPRGVHLINQIGG